MKRSADQGGYAHPQYSPDGLGLDVIEVLLAEAREVWARSPRPTSALLDGSAARRAARRGERRAFAAVVRALPGRPAVGSDADEAA